MTQGQPRDRPARQRNRERADARLDQQLGVIGVGIGGVHAARAKVDVEGQRRIDQLREDIHARDAAKRAQQDRR